MRRRARENGAWIRVAFIKKYAGTVLGAALLLALAVVVIGGGAGWYFKIYRPKKQRAAESEADYGGEYDGAEDYDETAPEDDGPPWDEDGEE